MTPPPKFDKERIPEDWKELPVLSASTLRVTPLRTVEDIMHDIGEGRVSEMTPGLAGY